MKLRTTGNENETRSKNLMQIKMPRSLCFHGSVMQDDDDDDIDTGRHLDANKYKLMKMMT